jgi:hypothetical protein
LVTEGEVIAFANPDDNKVGYVMKGEANFGEVIGVRHLLVKRHRFINPSHDGGTGITFERIWDQNDDRMDHY